MISCLHEMKDEINIKSVSSRPQIKVSYVCESRLPGPLKQALTSDHISDSCFLKWYINITTLLQLIIYRIIHSQIHIVSDVFSAYNVQSQVYDVTSFHQQVWTWKHFWSFTHSNIVLRSSPFLSMGYLCKLTWTDRIILSYDTNQARNSPYHLSFNWS